jgi:hypothetical protein
MQASSGPHDERFWERYEDFRRVVRSAEEPTPYKPALAASSPTTSHLPAIGKPQAQASIGLGSLVSDTMTADLMRKLVRKPSRAAHGEANGLALAAVSQAQDARRAAQQDHPRDKEIAHQYGPGALKELARIATQGESEAARVAA